MNSCFYFNIKRPEVNQAFLKIYFLDFFLYRALPLAYFAKSAAKAVQSVFSKALDPIGLAATRALASAVN
jgi:hypothetical protein